MFFPRNKTQLICGDRVLIKTEIWLPKTWCNWNKTRDRLTGVELVVAKPGVT
jgi:hypothetical protein